MQTQRTLARDGVLVARGYGLKIYVERGHLVVHEGVGRQRNTTRLNRITGGLSRLIVLGHTGFITFEAMRWIRDVGATFVQLDGDGQIVALSAAPGSDLAVLRRAQALGSTTAVGVEIARQILTAKLAGQAALLPDLNASRNARDVMQRNQAAVADSPTIAGMLAAEARAAGVYWGSWGRLPVRFAVDQRCSLPDHWALVGTRHSPLSRSPRLAITPAHAILNYLYALLEAETIHACHAVGLDPGLGLFHADTNARASLALDLMEATRPVVDAYVLAYLTERTLRPDQFVESRRGSCRLHPQLAAELSATLPTWRFQTAEVVERVAQAFASGRTPVPTPLTGSARSQAWDTRRKRPARNRTPKLALPVTCRGCGVALSDRRRRSCDDCRQHEWLQRSATGRAVAARVLADLRAGGIDPAHGGDAARARGEKNAAHQRAVRAWDKDRGAPSDPEEFRAQILPQLRTRANVDLVAVTGLSEHYCSLIRLGKRIPHPRHWDALRRVVAAP